MAEPSGDKPKLKLPDNTPKELKEFLACTRKEIDLDLDDGDLGWLLTALEMPDGLSPTIDFTPTPGKENHGTLTVQLIPGEYGKKMPFVVSIVEGRLEIETDDESLKDRSEKIENRLNHDVELGEHCREKAEWDPEE